MLAFLSKKTGEHYPVKRKALRGGAKKAFGNKYSDGLDYDLEKGSVEGFMNSHNKKQRIYAHALLHNPDVIETLPRDKVKALHNAIVKRDIKNHHSRI